MLASVVLVSLAAFQSTVSAASLGLAPRAAPTEPVAEFGYPPSRGTHIDSAKIGPCQGIFMGGRFEYPLTSGGQITLTTTRDINDLTFSYSTNEDPQALSDFTALGLNVDQRYAGTTCLNTPSFSALGLKATQNITLMMQYTAGQDRTTFYECTDLTLVEDSVYKPQAYTCANVTESTQTKGNNNSATEDSASTSPSSPSCSSTTITSNRRTGISSAVGGVIGAVIALFVAAVAALVAAKLGYAVFGRRATKQWKQEATILQDRHASTAHLDQKSVNGAY